MALMSKKRALDVMNRLDRLKARRANWDEHFQELSEYVYPRRQDFVGRRTPGDKRMTKIFDATPIHAAELLASGLHGMVTNPANEWFSMSLTGLEDTEDIQVLRYLENASDKIYNAINRPSTGFSTHMHEFYMEYVIFGTAVMFVSENDTLDGLYFKAIPLSECYIAENANGEIDTLYRSFIYTTKQVVERWPDTAPRAAKQRYEKNNYDEDMDIVHAVMPSAILDDARIKKPYASVYMDKATNEVLSVGGYYEFPYLVSRFYKASGEEYGRCPTMTALPDIKMLNKIQQTLIRGVQKAVNPAVLVPDDGMMSPVRSLPDGLTYYRAGGDKPSILNEVGSLPVGIDFAESLRGRISQIFFLDQLQLREGPQMTATEVIQRTEERLRLLGPVLGRLQQEFLGPLIVRCFNIMNRLHLIDDIPDSIPGASELKIHYVSPVALAQKQIEAQGIMRSFEVLAPFIEMDPSVLDVFNKDALVRHTTTMFGVDPNVLHTKTEMAKLREDRAKAAQAENDSNNMREQSGALKNAAGAMKLMGEAEGGVG